MDFQGKVVLITGAGSGIGAATAKLFAKHGASLALVDKNLPNLEKVAAECKRIGKGVQATFKTELTSETETENLIKSVLSQFKRLDVLINNAGIVEFASIENASLSEFDKVFNTNLRAVYHLTMLAVPHLIATKGAIVNVSSVAGVRAVPNLVSYCMSKSAISQFTRCVALELAPKGVRVNEVNPGAIPTNIFMNAGMDDTAVKNIMEAAKKTHPLGRAGTAEEVAKAIAFLASEEASFSTGVSLLVDGGRALLEINEANEYLLK